MRVLLLRRLVSAGTFNHTLECRLQYCSSQGGDTLPSAHSGRVLVTTWWLFVTVLVVGVLKHKNICIPKILSPGLLLGDAGGYDHRADPGPILQRPELSVSTAARYQIPAAQLGPPAGRGPRALLSGGGGAQILRTPQPGAETRRGRHSGHLFRVDF